MTESVTGYITYVLFQIAGSGHQPYEQVAQCGMTLEGGVLAHNGRILGYLCGPAQNLPDTVLALSAWGVRQMTPKEAQAFHEIALPANSYQHNPETQACANCHQRRNPATDQCTCPDKAFLDTSGRIQRKAHLPDGENPVAV